MTELACAELARRHRSPIRSAVVKDRGAPFSFDRRKKFRLAGARRRSPVSNSDHVRNLPASLADALPVLFRASDGIVWARCCDAVMIAPAVSLPKIIQKKRSRTTVAEPIWENASGTALYRK
jgi:hypothetical protein